MTGAGKTTFLATIPPPLRVWVISAGKENIKVLEPYPHIQVTKINRWQQLLDVYLFAKRNLLEEDGKTPKVKPNFFDVIAFDTWTRKQILAMQMKAGRELVKEGDEAKYLTNVPRLGGDFTFWQQAEGLVTEWMGYFLDLPIHTLFMFQEITKDPQFEGDPLRTTLALSKSAITKPMEDLELVGRLYAEVDEPTSADPLAGITSNPDPTLRRIDPNAKVTRRLLIGPHDRYLCKGPTHILGYTVENPTWEKLAKSLEPKAYALENAPKNEETTPAAPAIAL